MENMALDPFAAIDQPAQGAEWSFDVNTASVLHRMTRAHLVGDRADTADARGDIWRLRKFSTAQERFEKTRRLENLQFHIDHLAAPDGDKHGALALNPGEVVNCDGAGLAHANWVTNANLAILKSRSEQQELPSLGLISKTVVRSCHGPSWASLSRRKGSAAALKVRKARRRSGLLTPSARLIHALSEPVFGVSIGP